MATGGDWWRHAVLPGAEARFRLISGNDSAPPQNLAQDTGPSRTTDARVIAGPLIRT